MLVSSNLRRELFPDLLNPFGGIHLYLVRPSNGLVSLDYLLWVEESISLAQVLGLENASG